MVNLQREGKDPDPILLSYIPALKAITDICADIKNKKGFVLKPQVSARSNSTWIYHWQLLLLARLFNYGLPGLLT